MGGIIQELGTWPKFDEDDIQAVTEVLRSGGINQWTGPEVSLFEGEYADYVGVPYAVALANGTVALELAMHALGIGRDDEVIVPCRTFVATASAVIMRQAVPVFADVDPESQVLTVETVELARTPRSRAVIAVHLAGWPCRLPELRRYCDEHGLFLIEDCAQAHGARIAGRAVGSFGHAAAFSFCQDKIISTGGEGGLLLTSDHGVYERAWSYKDHGRDFHLARQPQSSGNAFRWLCTGLGTNWRMTSIQAALGRLGLCKLDEMVRLRRRNADILRQAVAGLACVHAPMPPTDCLHSYYKFYLLLVPERLRDGWCRNQIMDELQKQGIPVQAGACPELYLEPIFTAVPYPDGSVRDLRPAERLPMAKRLGETSLMFQVHPTLTVEQMNNTAEILAEILKQACDSRENDQ